MSRPYRTATARANCRVDFAGGTLDIWPLGLLHPGASTVNLAIGLTAHVSLRPRAAGYRVLAADGAVLGLGETPRQLAALRPTALVGVAVESLALPPVDIELRTESPQGAGLGGSSALVIALIAAADAFLEREPGSPAARAALARDIEARLMALPTGTQDHYPALLGGALALHHRPGGTAIETLAVDLSALEDCLVVAYSGRSHFSAGANWTIVRRRLEGDEDIEELFSGIAEVARESCEVLRQGDFRRLGELMSEEWLLRRQLSPEVSTPVLENLLGVARSMGAWGGKACGAGGGGSIAVLAPPDRQASVRTALEASGAQLLEAKPTSAPVAVSVEEGHG